MKSVALEFPNDSPGLPSPQPVPPKQAQRTRVLAHTSHARPRAHTRHARTRTARPCACPRHAPASRVAIPVPCDQLVRNTSRANWCELHYALWGWCELFYTLFWVFCFALNIFTVQFHWFFSLVSFGTGPAVVPVYTETRRSRIHVLAI